MSFTKHIAGPFKPDLKQHCVLCGYELCNYQGAMVEGGGKIGGFPEGEIYVGGKNPTVFTITPPDNTKVYNCLSLT